MVKKFQNIRLADVAAEAGVSLSLASHILNKSSGKNIRASVETIEKVKTVAQNLRYTANSTAKALATKRTKCLGYVMSTNFATPWNNEYYGRYLSGVERCCRENGYGLLVGLCNMINARDFVIPEHVSNRRVDGLIIIGGIAPELWKLYNSYNIPTVLLDYTPDSAKPSYPYVEFAKRWEYKGIEYALSMGHKRIGIALSAYSSNCDFIFNKVNSAIKVFQKTHDCMVHIFRPPAPFSNWEYELGDILYEQWNSLPNKKRPTILLGGHSLIKYIKKSFMPRGILIPDQLSIATGPEYLSAELFSPAITTFDIDMELEGTTAAEMLIKHLEEEKPLNAVLIDIDKHITLKERESVRRLK